MNVRKSTSNGAESSKQETIRTKDESEVSVISTRLPKAELFCYGLWIVYFLLTSTVDFYSEYSTPEAFSPELQHDFLPGWFGRKRDASLRTFETYLKHIHWFLLLHFLYILFSKISNSIFPSALSQILCSCFSLGFVYLYFSAHAFWFLFIMFILFFMLSLTSKILVCAFMIFCLALPPTGTKFLHFLLVHLKISDYPLFYAIYGYLVCRFYSFADSLADIRNSSNDSHFSLLKLYLPKCLLYSFYWPSFILGSPLTFTDFSRQVDNRSNVNWIWVAQRSCRLVFWFMFSKFCIHFIYFHPFNLSLSNDAAFSAASYSYVVLNLYYRGQFFMMEYLQYYGVAMVFAKLDGIQLHDWPDCISRVYSYRKMWRVFDRGLFAIIRDHIYIPIGGNKHGYCRQLLGSFLSFLFICLYHGFGLNIQVWIALNFIQVFFESYVEMIYLRYIKIILIKWFSDQCLRRIVCFFGAFNILWSSMAMMFSLYPFEIAFRIVQKALLLPLFTGENGIGLLIYITVFYSYIQLAIEYERIEKARLLKKKKQ